MMNKRFNSICIILVLALNLGKVKAQDALYPNEFPLGDVKLLDGPFKHARDLNIKALLEYDTDRLLQPYLKEAGLPEKGECFPNWAGLDGHVGGHYLSALAMNYAATGNAECKKRMDYMLSELKACQDAISKSEPEWGVGYLGGVPNSKAIWSTFKNGDFAALRQAWVPWYNIHKMYCGLRDAWLYTGSEVGKTLFLNFCDWGVNISKSLTEEQMQTMLGIEHGGMNEVFADAYQMTGDKKYLEAAKRFSHHQILDAMAANEDNLDNKHANTQVPKAVGFHRVGELAHDHEYLEAGSFFWETVTGNRTLAFGGNSRREFFPSVAASHEFVTDIEGPESCNSYNMLKLTEDLFRANPEGKYVDYYERTLYNHILSTQHPEHGGYVYFTPVRPQHYRVYSAPNEAMWCCVGSGMENHGKYNQFIYTREDDSLYVNLFVASELNWKDEKVKIRQETGFPEESKTKLIITEGSSDFTLMVRYPGWVAEGALTIKVNGKEVTYTAKPSSFIGISRDWKKGDVVEVNMPMHTRVEELPNVDTYVAFLHGPILLSAKVETENLQGLVADDGRWSHIAGGKKLPVDEAPGIITNDINSVAKNLTPVKGKPLHFTLPEVKMANPTKVELQPFYKIHDSRYMMYWMTLSDAKYRTYLDSLAIIEKERQALENRTVDFVAPGEQQPEADHMMKADKSNTGNRNDEFWRDAREDGYFSYRLATNGESNLKLRVRYWGAERGRRKFDIEIDGQLLVTEDLSNKWNEQQFKDVEYAIPADYLKGKTHVEIKVKPQSGNVAGPLFYIRLVR